jgi:hypothetical protein
LVIAVLACAGCGGSTKTVTIAPTRSLPPGVTAYTPLPAPRSVTYSINLISAAGVPPSVPAGAPHGSGLAVITIDAFTDELCWRFSLRNVVAPTDARTYEHTGRENGLGGERLDGAYKPSGCVHKPAFVLSQYEERPQEFWLSIHTAKYPAGAVRGQL